MVLLVIVLLQRLSFPSIFGVAALSGHGINSHLDWHNTSAGIISAGTAAPHLPSSPRLFALPSFLIFPPSPRLFAPPASPPSLPHLFVPPPSPPSPPPYLRRYPPPRRRACLRRHRRRLHRRITPTTPSFCRPQPPASPRRHHHRLPRRTTPTTPSFLRPCRPVSPRRHRHHLHQRTTPTIPSFPQPRQYCSTMYHLVMAGGLGGFRPGSPAYSISPLDNWHCLWAVGVGTAGAGAVHALRVSALLCVSSVRAHCVHRQTQRCK